VALWDITSEIPVAAFVCRIIELRNDRFSPSDAIDGAGCHPCREIALSRAITEAIQCRATLISGARDDLFPFHYAPPDPSELTSVHNSVLARRHCGRKFDSVPTVLTSHSLDDLEHLLVQLRPRVHHVVALNITRPEAAMPTVRLLVPELEDGEESEGYVPRRRALDAYMGRA
jgi:ribosomal protein S12 methylthiotransferase accessory factor